MLRLWNRKGVAIRKWRARAWTIDPKVTNLTIINTASKLESMNVIDFNLDSTFSFVLDFPKLLKAYPEYFEAIVDLELLC
jgi:hypothetical protein